MPSPSVPDTAAVRPAHRDPNVLRWLGAYTSSAVGDTVYYVALSWAAVQTGTPAEAGLVTAVSAVPRALLMLGGGVVTDRYGPRPVVLGSSAARCLLVVLAAAMLTVADPGLWALGGVALLFGIVDAVFLPAASALPARITGRGQLARVHGMRGLATRLATVFGGPLGGLGIALGGTAGAFGLAALLIGVSLPVLWAVRVGRPASAAEGVERPRGTALAELKDGLRHIAQDRVLRPLVLAMALADLGFVGPMNLGLTLLAREKGWGSAGMGWVLAGFGAGAGAASLLLALRGRVPRAGLVMAVAELVGCAAIAALAHAPSVLAAAAVALAIGLAAGLGGALRGALLQVTAGPAYVGRDTSAATLVGFGVAPLTFPLVGAAVARWSAGPVFAGCAAICALGVLVTLCSAPLRRAELPR
ncbi:MFS transporter [Streptomyces purpurascens]|uniref:MFS transporter n=1 Tax=Streptomyces purpurascens TaxID=1924 RepID=UPI001675758A|nr:MFS transporter [Streptomyces purpurascens]GHA51419.1 MFS transporter [Streptomyces purpurascens]